MSLFILVEVSIDKVDDIHYAGGVYVGDVGGDTFEQVEASHPSLVGFRTFSFSSQLNFSSGMATSRVPTRSPSTLLLLDRQKRAESRLFLRLVFGCIIAEFFQIEAHLAVCAK